MNNFKISIPTPCHEDWQKMIPATNGRYCNSCEKTVIDFTGKKPEEIKSIIDNSTGKICGRFNTNDVFQPEEKTSSELVIKRAWYQSRWLAITTLISLVGFSKKSNAQLQGQVIDTSTPIIKKTGAKKNSTVIHGWIKSIDDKKGLAQVEIRIYSGGKEIAYTKNFANGSYFITIPENTIWDFKIDIEYNAVNFTTQILRDLPINKDRIKCDINLTETLGNSNITTMGGVGINYSNAFGDGPGIGNSGVQPEVYYYDEPEIKTDTTIGDTIVWMMDKTPGTVTKLDGEIKKSNETNSQENSSFTVTAYPNPGNGIFNFRIDNSEKTEIFVFNIDGKLVESKKTSSSLEVLDLSNQPNGTYVVRVVSISLNKVKQVKVIKID